MFLGDSVTTGSPPTPDNDFYRSRLADQLVQQFGLQAPTSLWKAVNWTTGQTVVMESGDFASCAKWGARADDLMRDHTQVLACLPESQRDKPTLVIMTIGGNDIAAIAKAGGDGVALDTTWSMAHDSVDLLRDAITWMHEPGRFPNGIDIVFNTVHEYTDGTGDTSSCLVGAAAYKPWADPQALRDIMIWLNEQYVALAVESRTDVVFMLENFCGHGFHNNDPASPCYRGPNTPRWLDDTCVHQPDRARRGGEAVRERDRGVTSLFDERRERDLRRGHAHTDVGLGIPRAYDLLRDAIAIVVDEARRTMDEAQHLEDDRRQPVAQAIDERGQSLLADREDVTRMPDARSRHATCRDALRDRVAVELLHDR